MSLTARKNELGTVIQDARTLIANCDSDLLAGDPDSAEIARLREEAQGALEALGENDRSVPT